MQPEQITPLCIGCSFRRVDVFCGVVGLESAAAKRYRPATHIQYGNDQPSAKTIVRATFVFLNYQTAALNLRLRGALLPEVRRERFPTVRPIAEMKRLSGFVSDLPFFQILT